MNPYFVMAGVIAVILGIAHSYMGERYLVIPILKSEQLTKHLSGSIGLKKVALRVSWHFATIAMWGAASTLVFLSSRPLNPTAMVVNYYSDLFCGYAPCILYIGFAAYLPYSPPCMDRVLGNCDVPEACGARPVTLILEATDDEGQTGSAEVHISVPFPVC
jgi:hypothetical protein